MKFKHCAASSNYWVRRGSNLNISGSSEQFPRVDRTECSGALSAWTGGTSRPWWGPGWAAGSSSPCSDWALASEGELGWRNGHTAWPRLSDCTTPAIRLRLSHRVQMLEEGEFSNTTQSSPSSTVMTFLQRLQGQSDISLVSVLCSNLRFGSNIIYWIHSHGKFWF